MTAILWKWLRCALGAHKWVHFVSVYHRLYCERGSYYVCENCTAARWINV
jgi:hypothetical protein